MPQNQDKPNEDNQDIYNLENYCPDEDLTDYDLQVIRLSQELENSRSWYKELIFYIFLSFIFFMDLHIFIYMDNWGSPISLMIIELVVLFFLARKCEMHSFIELIDKFAHSYNTNNK